MITFWLLRTVKMREYENGDEFGQQITNDDVNVIVVMAQPSTQSMDSDRFSHNTLGIPLLPSHNPNPL